ncbi:MAG: helix-turn-helix domain-containing protein [Opitutales bacterium]|nr:helix-turn-helix domain-containing protein [Opitutales bacterium]
MKHIIHDPEHFGKALRQVRNLQGLTQQELALTANTAPRFISDLERGKPTCQIGKALHVASCLGLHLELNGGES